MNLIKKTLFSILVMTSSFTVANAQEYGIADHLGAGIGVGTEGINISIATGFTSYVEAEFGVNFMPGVSINEHSNVNFKGSGGQDHSNSGVDVKASMARTSFDFKASVYPFGTKNNFFVAAGLSFGGKKIMSMTGIDYDRTIKEEEEPWISIGNQHVDLKPASDGYYHLDAEARVNPVRPYIGVGYGRLVPKSRLGFRVELGCQFHGKAKIYANGEEIKPENFEDKDEDTQKYIDTFTFYPVLKFSLRGKIF